VSLASTLHAVIPAVLSIAGSDSGGGAGIQADLKAFARCGVHGMTAITALTAQNTVGVKGVHAVPGDFIVEQVKAVQDDIGVDAVKIGMLGTLEIVEAVGRALDLLPPGTPIVIDPVMVSESGAVLLDEDARGALVELLIARATVITPNIPEAAVLAQTARLNTGIDQEALAQALHSLGPGAVVVTGGHSRDAADVFFDGTALESIPGERYSDGAAHGSGCTHSSALAAYLARGFDPLTAATRAKTIAAEAIRNGLRDIGAGAGPVNALSAAAHPPDAA
jgi:hydroxymethylpyrimidine/phosphomethylpyrimidine kinase